MQSTIRLISITNKINTKYIEYHNFSWKKLILISKNENKL